MPYTGFAVKHGSSKWIIRIHGPQEYVDVNTQEARTFVRDFLELERSINLPDVSNRLAKAVCDKFCDGIDKIWVQAEITTSYEVIYGASAERITPDEV